jgi:hypothetical protein
MKKILMLFAILTTMLVSCGEESTESTDTTTPPTTEEGVDVDPEFPTEIREYVALRVYSGNESCRVSDPSRFNGYLVLIYRDTSLGIDNRVGQPGSPFTCNSDNRITLKPEPLPNTLILTRNEMATGGWTEAVEESCMSLSVGASEVIEVVGTWLTMVGDNQVYRVNTDLTDGELFMTVSDCLSLRPN